MKGGRTQREEGHKGRMDMKGGRTRREKGHEGRKGGYEGKKNTKGGRRGGGTMDCPNKGDETTE
jgi:hypothetical protein